MMTYWGWLQSLTFNRTIVELKLFISTKRSGTMFSFNRTIVELKRVSVSITALSAKYF